LSDLGLIVLRMEPVILATLDNGRESHLYGKMEQGRNIILIGYRATGKSLIGRKLADRLGCEFLDMDRAIEMRQGRTIREMVAAHGWPYFRALERELLLLLAERRGLVIATGGGVVLQQEAWSCLKASGLVVWLTADRETICKRLGSDARTGEQRPSLTGRPIEAEIEQVLAEREPLYREGADLVVDTCNRQPDEIVGMIIERGMVNIPISDSPAPHF
jgi:shikimate kinase